MNAENASPYFIFLQQATDIFGTLWRIPFKTQSFNSKTGHIPP